MIDRNIISTRITYEIGVYDERGISVLTGSTLDLKFDPPLMPVAEVLAPNPPEPPYGLPPLIPRLAFSIFWRCSSLAFSRILFLASRSCVCKQNNPIIH